MPEIVPEIFAEMRIGALRFFRRSCPQMVPALGGYFGDDGTLAAPVAVDGGYYTKAADNMPMIGPVPDAPRGCYMCAIPRPLPPRTRPILSRFSALSSDAPAKLVVIGAPRCRATV